MLTQRKPRCEQHRQVSQNSQTERSAYISNTLREPTGGWAGTRQVFLLGPWTSSRCLAMEDESCLVGPFAPFGVWQNRWCMRESSCRRLMKYRPLQSWDMWTYHPWKAEKVCGWLIHNQLDVLILKCLMNGLIPGPSVRDLFISQHEVTNRPVSGSLLESPKRSLWRSR